MQDNQLIVEADGRQAPAISSLNYDPSASVLLKEILEGIKSINTSLERNITSNGDPQDQFWMTYLQEAKKYDDEHVEKYKNNMDIVVFFAGLFSTVVAGFLAALQPALSPSPSDTTNTLLMILIQNMDNSTLSNQSLSISPQNGPAPTVIYSQALNYVSLSLGLFAAVGAMMGKQWLFYLTQHGEGTDEVRARRRQQKLDGHKAWRFDTCIQVLPALLQVAFALFSIALCINLWGINTTVAVTFTCVTALGGLVYVAFTVSSLWFPLCPYETPLASVIRWMIITTTDTSEELLYHLKTQHWRTMSELLTKLFPLLLLPILGWGTVTLTILVVTLWSAVMWRLGVPLDSVLTKLHRIRDRFRPQLHQYPEFPSIVWLLGMTTRHDVITEAVERIPSAVEEIHDGSRWRRGKERRHDEFGQPSFDLFPSIAHLCDLFIDSVTAMNQSFSAGGRDRALALGKALIDMLSQDVKKLSVHPYFWNEAKREFERFRTDIVGPEIAYLVQLVIALLPIEDDNTAHLQPEAILTANPSFNPFLAIWSLPILERTLRDPYHGRLGLQKPYQNQRLIDLFKSRVLRSVRFSDKAKWNASEAEQTAYFSVCQSYLEILCCSDNDKETNSTLDWSVVHRILENVSAADDLLCRREDECFPAIVNHIRELLEKNAPSWPDNIRTAVHKFSFRIYGLANNSSTATKSLLLEELVNSTIKLAVSCPLPEGYVCPDIDLVLPLLLDHLEDSWSNSREERPIVYLLKLLPKDSSDHAKEFIWSNSDVRVVNYIIDPSRSSSFQHMSLGTLWTACRSRPDDILEPLVRRRGFLEYIHRAIRNPPSCNTGLRLLDTALPRLLRSGLEEARTQFADTIFQIPEKDVLPETHFSLIRIKCTLCTGAGERRNEILTYWQRWAKEKTALKVAQVVPVARWVLIHCKYNQDQFWYTELQDSFEGLLRGAWSSDFKNHSALLSGLVGCTEEWLRSPDHSASGTANITIMAVRHAANHIVKNWLKYRLDGVDINTLQRLRNAE